MVEPITRSDREAANPPHALSARAAALALESDIGHGLSEGEASARLERVGANAVERRGRPPYGAIAARQLADPLVALLVAAAAVSFAIGERLEASAIGAIVLLNGVLGFTQELGAERAVFALREAVAALTNVVRDGRERALPVEQVVPGDVIVLREGQRIPADGRLVSAHGLSVDEAILTGESVPADKSTEPVPVTSPLAERSSVVFGGTAVTRGRGTALVTATGPSSEVARVAALAEKATPPPTPLQRRLRGLTRLMVALGVLITLVLAGARLVQDASVEEAFLLGVSVAVAAVPEGLAATVTIALALGARRMAAQGAIVRRLPAVETLGSATVIASDKTGTLTQNELRFQTAAAADTRHEDELLSAAVLASTAELVDDAGEVRVAGDPVEGALLLAARDRGISPAELRGARRLVREIPFDPERKRMTVVYEEDDGVRAFTKGAPEVVIGRSHAQPAEKERLEAVAERWAGQGLRVLAVGERTLDAAPPDDDVLERDLELLGLVGLHDPLRDSAADAVRSARAAGLRVEILTGDHAATAGAIARALDLPAEAVSARVTPRDKLRIVEGLQEDGEVVAVTGDGVNDAPALRQADVGVAMGRSGTEAAREASELVLTDDDFSTIVAAIREGRAIADNVRKFVAFVLSSNFGEVLLFAAAVFAGLGAPMTVAQVLMVNVLTDGLPAVALARDPGLPDVMRRRPERGDKLFRRESWLALGLVGLVVGAASLGTFLIGRAVDLDAAQTMAFANFAFAKLVVVFAVRSPLDPFWREPLNPLLLVAVAGSAVLVLLAVYMPPLQDAFGTVALDGGQLGIVAGLAAVPFVVVELAKGLLRRTAPGWAASALRASR